VDIRRRRRGGLLRQQHPRGPRVGSTAGAVLPVPLPACCAHRRSRATSSCAPTPSTISVALSPPVPACVAAPLSLGGCRRERRCLRQRPRRLTPCGGRGQRHRRLSTSASSPTHPSNLVALSPPVPAFAAAPCRGGCRRERRLFWCRPVAAWRVPARAAHVVAAPAPGPTPTTKPLALSPPVLASAAARCRRCECRRERPSLRQRPRGPLSRGGSSHRRLWHSLPRLAPLPRPTLRRCPLLFPHPRPPLAHVVGDATRVAPCGSALVVRDRTAIVAVAAAAFASLSFSPGPPHLPCVPWLAPGWL